MVPNRSRRKDLIASGSVLRILRFVFLGAVLFLVLAYAGDALALRLRIPDPQQRLGSVHVQRTLAVPQKNGKTEFIKDDPLDMPCVHSFFPHFGNEPCWYVERHKQQLEPM